MVAMTVYLISTVNYWNLLKKKIQDPTAHGLQMALELYFNRTNPAAFCFKDILYFVSWGLNWSCEQDLTPVNHH